MWLSSKIIYEDSPVGKWEDFQVGNRLDTRFGGTASWNRVTDKGGAAVLSYTGGQGHSQLWDNTTVYNASDNVYIEAFVRADGFLTTNLTGLAFGKQSGSNANGYQVLIDRRSNAFNGSSAGFQLRRSTSTGVLASQGGISIIHSRWYRIEVNWRTTGTRITCRLYDDTNTLLSTLTSSNSTYTSGRIGAYSYNPGSIDDIDVIVGP